MIIFALLKNKNEDTIKIKRIPISSELQNDLENYLSPSIKYYNNSDKVIFCGEYKPDDNEVLYIENFIFDYDLSNPLNIEILNHNEIENIKSLVFVNDNFYAFQVFDSKKIIKVEKLALIYSNNSFSKLDNKGLIIDSKIDALYLFNDRKLFFISFYNSSKIFNLTDFYREATDNEIIQKFYSNKIFNNINKEYDPSKFNAKLRKKIHLIIINKILEKIKDNFDIVYNYANELGLNFFDKTNKKIILPEKKEDIEKLINFLNEDLYKSPITKNIYKTNSKKKLNQK